MSLPTLASGCLAHGRLLRGCRLLVQTPTVPGDREFPRTGTLQLVTSSRPQHLSLYLLSTLWVLGRGLGIPSISASARPLWITSDRKLNSAWLKEWECISWYSRRSSRVVGLQGLLDAGFKRHLEDSVPSLSIAFCQWVAVSDFSMSQMVAGAPAPLLSQPRSSETTPLPRAEESRRNGSQWPDLGVPSPSLT